MGRPGNTGIASLYAVMLAAVGVPALLLISPTFVDEESIAVALRRTADLAFLIFVTIFAARPAWQINPTRFTHKLLQLRPWLGVSFAATMTVHLALIGWLFIFVTGQVPPVNTLLVGGIAYALTFLMLATTFEAPARRLGRKNWKRLHKTGVSWLTVIFANALISRVIRDPGDLLYLFLAALLVLVIVLRIAAFAKSRFQKTAATDAAR